MEPADEAVANVVEMLEGSTLVGVEGAAFLSDTEGDLTLRYLGDWGAMDWR